MFDVMLGLGISLGLILVMIIHIFVTMGGVISVTKARIKKKGNKESELKDILKMMTYALTLGILLAVVYPIDAGNTGGLIEGGILLTVLLLVTSFEILSIKLIDVLRFNKFVGE